VNVFTVTADQLLAAQRVDFSVPSGSTNLIDVTFSSDQPTSLNLTGLSSGIFYGCPNDTPSPTNWSNGNCGSQPSGGDNTSTIGQERDDTVWNFSPSLFPSNYALSFVSWQGTVVAPDAAVSLSSGQFDGSVFAASLAGGEQTNFDPFGYGEPIPAGVGPIPSFPRVSRLPWVGWAFSAWAAHFFTGVAPRSTSPSPEGPIKPAEPDGRSNGPVA
jgi:hypothetical protein